LLKKRRHQFHFWFWLTVVLYLALGGLILWGQEKGAATPNRSRNNHRTGCKKAWSVHHRSSSLITLTELLPLYPRALPF
jgi:hypothetical protein